MGHFVTGVVGAALARNGKAVAIVGDGAMLMNSEVSTAVKYQIPAVWIVLNDGHYNMCKQGMALLGFEGIDAKIPQADFAAIARGMGADGIRVENESELEAVLEEALDSTIPLSLMSLSIPSSLHLLEVGLKVSFRKARRNLSKYLKEFYYDASTRRDSLACSQISQHHPYQ